MLANLNVITRNVSFRYPGSEKYALRDVSFEVGPGQLCVRPSVLYPYRYESRLTSHRVVGHPWSQWVREKHNREAFGSYI
jgi:hypothetical protein